MTLVKRWVRLADGVRTRLWPVPAIGVALAVCAGISIPEVDSALDGRIPPIVSAYLFGGGSDAAREVLSAIASSLITVTSLTFSLTVVTLQLASQQFSPRLLRTFARDRFVQRTLALFLGTFVYALTVLRTVRDSNGDQAMFVPQLAVTVAYLLALASVIGLVLFLGHLVRQIRVETLLATVSADARSSVAAVLGDSDVAACPEPLPTPPPSAVTVTASSTGFLVAVEGQSLCDAAAATDSVVQVDRMPGEWVVKGTPVAVVWSRGHEPLSDEARETMLGRIAAAIHLGEERTSVQDVAYGLRQLVDVALKALSPGINDPTTAVYALGQLSALLCEMVGRDLGPAVYRDADDQTRLMLARPDFARLLDVAIGQPRHYGGGDGTVLAALLHLLHDVAWRASMSAQREAVSTELDRTRRTLSGQDFDPVELARLHQLATSVEQALATQGR